MVKVEGDVWVKQVPLNFFGAFFELLEFVLLCVALPRWRTNI